jgi:hypothetical protein
MIPLRAMFCRTAVDVRCWRTQYASYRKANLSMPYPKLIKVVEKAKYLEKPQNDDNYDDAIQDALDLSLHRYVAVYQKEQ